MAGRERRFKWDSGSAVPINDALEAFLDELERHYSETRIDRLENGEQRPLVPMSTGIRSLDQALGGGLRPGRLTLVEADIEAQANALLCTVTHRTPEPVLLDGPRFLENVVWLLASVGSIPEVVMSTLELREADWPKLAQASAELADRNIFVCSAESLDDLRHSVVLSTAAVLVVRDADRFGPPSTVVPALAELAEWSEVAIVASTADPEELPGHAYRDVDRISMLGFNLGGNAALLRVDPYDMVTGTRIQVECLSGTIR